MATTTAPPDQPNALATQAPPAKDIKALLKSDQLKKAVEMALPRHLSPDRFVRIALNAVMRQPELLACSQESLFRCLLDLSAYGLEPDGRRAHLIPFRDNKHCACGHETDAHKGPKCSQCECSQRRPRMDVQLIIDYKGLAELIRRSGDVSYIHADVVYAADEFDYAYGSGAFLKHKPALEGREGKPTCAYSFVRLKDGSEDFIVLSVAEVEKVRKRSRAGNNGPWVTDFDEMAKKTAFRRHSKWLPLSPEMRDVVERDDELTGADTDIAMNIASSAEVKGESFKERLLSSASAEASTQGGGEEPDHVRTIRAMQELIGDDAFWRIMGANGYENPAEIPADKFQPILREMDEELKAQKGTR